VGVEPDVVDGDDVGVVEATEHPDLLDEARHDRRPAFEFGEQSLEGHRALDVIVAREQHLAAAAAPEHLRGLEALPRVDHQPRNLPDELHPRQDGRP